MYLSLLKERFEDYFTQLEFPRKEDFDIFDVNKDGVLFYEEWYKSLAWSWDLNHKALPTYFIYFFLIIQFHISFVHIPL